jgi:hypothetical protein
MDRQDNKKPLKVKKTTVVVWFGKTTRSHWKWRKQPCSLSVASCCLVDPFYHGRFLQFQWLVVVLSIHTTTVVFFTFSGFLLSCRSILPRSFSQLSVASCCLADPYYHGCFLHFQWLLVVLSVHTTTVVFFTFSGFLLSCRSILPRSFSSLSVASCCLVDSFYYVRSEENDRGSMDRQDNKKPLKVEKTTVVVWTDKTTRSHW